ncbi:glycine-rich protein 5-like [Diachasma alloeum]|uniref:glycine-rich protein 5-like n=1 Tax=Diachasma alloeum TaxID=454923 RepID=UPI0007383EE8|nr:glycine-rich protein 5-like [Diachasma alloeum]
MNARPPKRFHSGNMEQGYSATGHHSRMEPHPSTSRNVEIPFGGFSLASRHQQAGVSLSHGHSGAKLRGPMTRNQVSGVKSQTSRSPIVPISLGAFSMTAKVPSLKEIKNVNVGEGPVEGEALRGGSVANGAVGGGSVGKGAVGGGSVGKGAVGGGFVGKGAVGGGSVGKEAVGSGSVGKAVVGGASVGKGAVGGESVDKGAIGGGSVAKGAVGGGSVSCRSGSWC